MNRSGVIRGFFEEQQKSVRLNVGNLGFVERDLILTYMEGIFG